MKTVLRMAFASRPSSSQVPTRTSTMGLPASKPSSTSRRSGGTGLLLIVAGSAKT